MSPRQPIHTEKAPAPVAKMYSQAMVCNGMVYCSGQLGMDPETKEFKGSIEERTKQCLQNLSAVLSAAGSSLANAVKINIYTTSMDSFAAVNREYEKWFEEPKPARTFIAVHQLPLNSDVEIECVAHLDFPGRPGHDSDGGEAEKGKGGFWGKVPFVGDL